MRIYSNHLPMMSTFQEMGVVYTTAPSDWMQFFTSIDMNMESWPGLLHQTYTSGFIEDSIYETADPEDAAKLGQVGSIIRAQNNAVVPVSLGNTISDPQGVFERIGSPIIPNLDSLIYWFRMQTENVRSQGWSGRVRDIWAELLAGQGQSDRAMLSLSSYVVLKSQAGLTNSKESQQQILRAKVLVIQELQEYKEVTSLLLVVIVRLALASIAEGDFQAADAHLQALGRLYRPDLVLGAVEWLFVWGTDLAIASTLMRPPVLPYHCPETLSAPFSLSDETLRHCHRMASKNAMSLMSALGEDYTLVLRILENLHQSYTFYSRPGNAKGKTDDLSVYGRLYMHVYQTSTFFEKCRNEVGCAGTFLAYWRQILAAVLELAAWHSTIYHLPPEGVLQANLLKYASSVLRKAGELDWVVEMWCIVADVDSLLWCAAILIVEAQLHSPDEMDLWLDVLSRATSKAGVRSSQGLRQTLAPWPYDSVRLEHIYGGDLRPLKGLPEFMLFR